MGFINDIKDSLKKNLGLNSDKGTVLMAPITGQIVPIEQTSDPVFADKVVGDGVAIDPTDNVLVAPCEGVIGKIFETNHAFSLDTPSGVEVFIHFGIDTVALKGEGFKRLATEGQEVKTGDPVLEVDFSLLKSSGKSLVTPIVIPNLDDIGEIEKISGDVKAGVDPILIVHLK